MTLTPRGCSGNVAVQPREAVGRGRTVGLGCSPEGPRLVPKVPAAVFLGTIFL